jgi:hypothetical protein
MLEVMDLLHHRVDIGHPNQGVIVFLKLAMEEDMGVQNHLKAMDLLLLLLVMALQKILGPMEGVTIHIHHPVDMDHQKQWVMVHLNQVFMEMNMGLQNHLEGMDLPQLLVAMEMVMGLQFLQKDIEKVMRLK